MNSTVFMALIATLGTWFITALGSATVFFFRNTNEKLMNLMLGFAAGVMIAASFWSLLQPAIERSEEYLDFPAYLIVGGGFLCGAVFMWLTDKCVSHARKKFSLADSDAAERTNRMMLLILSITLHNIPEGLAVGVAFGALNSVSDAESLMGAITIAVGIGLQNFPEGAAISLPLRREGKSRRKSFFIGQLSGMAEPISGVLGAILVVYMRTILPFVLAFAAGAMILVAVHELIPECQANRKGGAYTATMGIVSGFTVMMILDVALG